MKKIITKHLRISDQQYENWASLASLKLIPKKTTIWSADQVCTKLLFVEKGIIRAYRLVDGQAFTHYFYPQDWFATDYKSYLREKPGELYLETLTETRYYEFQKADLQKFYEANPVFEKLGRLIAERAYLLMVDRLTDFQTSDLKGRYQKLIEQHPELFQQVPQKYIASYLGVSEQSLSRIKTNFLPNVNGIVDKPS